MASENRIQAFVHKLEEGGWAKWIRRAVVVAGVLYVVNLWFFKDSGFKGLNHERVMEQAQISREIARGNGFSTKMIRPAALWQFKENMGAFPIENTPDTYHAPLNPYINSLFLRLTKSSWEMTTKDIQYPSDKVIAGVQTAFFLMAVLLNYFTVWRLFDQKLATFVTLLLLVCERFWDFSMSGLPQMLMLLIFSAALHTLVRAIQARGAGTRTWGWAIGAGFCFGLLALAHALTLWIFAGALFFTAFAFAPRGRDAAIMLAVVAVMYAPWMVRNQKVCGNPVGLGWYSGLFQIRGTESEVMRSMVVPLRGVTPTVFRNKIQGQIIQQFGQMYEYLGHLLLAPAFFIALLHLFKRPETALFRWLLFSMWFFAVLGMSVFGLDSESTVSRAASTLHSNDLHVLFIPLFTAYGMAFVLMLWSRMDMSIRIIRLGFIAALFLISAAPFLQQFTKLVGQRTSPVQWPPYVPPFIAILNTWTNEREIIASDMPWAVAWYADRKSLWLPMTIGDFLSLNDYNLLGNHLIGLYLTPVSGDRAFLSDIAKGEFREWSPFILRQTDALRDFPLRARTPLPIDQECMFYSDRDRWTNRED